MVHKTICNLNEIFILLVRSVFEFNWQFVTLLVLSAGFSIAILLFMSDVLLRKVHFANVLRCIFLIDITNCDWESGKWTDGWAEIPSNELEIMVRRIELEINVAFPFACDWDLVGLWGFCNIYCEDDYVWFAFLLNGFRCVAFCWNGFCIWLTVKWSCRMKFHYI